MSIEIFDGNLLVQLAEDVRIVAVFFFFCKLFTVDYAKTGNNGVIKPMISKKEYEYYRSYMKETV